MNMAHIAMVRTLMEEAESGRMMRAMIEYWSDPVDGKRRRVKVEVVIYETEYSDVMGESRKS